MSTGIRGKPKASRRSFPSGCGLRRISTRAGRCADWEQKFLTTRALADDQQSRLLELTLALNDAHKSLRSIQARDIDFDALVDSAAGSDKRSRGMAHWNGALHPQLDAPPVKLTLEAEAAPRRPLKLSICKTPSPMKRTPLSVHGNGAHEAVSESGEPGPPSGGSSEDGVPGPPSRGSSEDGT